MKMRPAHPAETLWNKAKDYNVPLKRAADQLMGDRTYDCFNAYSQYFIVDNAIENAVNYGRMDEVPSPIIAIQYMPEGYPIYYYIKKDLIPPQERKRKTVKPKPKRKVKKCRCK